MTSYKNFHKNGKRKKVDLTYNIKDKTKDKE